MTGHIRIQHRLGTVTLDVDMPIAPGITAIFGPSGAGKTSILRAVAGLLTPEDGRIEIAGALWFDPATGVNLPAHRRKLGYVFQEPRLFPHLTVAQNLRFGAPRGQDISGMVALLGLGPLLDRRPAGLSGGEAQRVALGRALLATPGILLMDEPLSALDMALKREILPYIERLRRETGVPILYVSHDIDEVARLADQVVLIEAGHTTDAQPVAQALAGAKPGSALGRTIAGGLLTGTVVAHHPTEGLTEISLGGPERLWLPGLHAPMGGPVQLRVEARDVALSLTRPEGLSALNILPVTITRIDAGPGAGALIRLDHRGQTFAARLTARSVRLLELAPGQSVHAVIKTMSLAQR